MRNRLSYSNEHKALELLEDAYLKGISVDDLKQLARRARKRFMWEDEMYALLDET